MFRKPGTQERGVKFDLQALLEMLFGSLIQV